MSNPVTPGSSPCSVCGRPTGGCCTVNANYPVIPERSAAWSIQNMPRILEERNAAEAKVAEYERIFAEIWGNAMTDCGPEDYALLPEMLALHDKLQADIIAKFTKVLEEIANHYYTKQDMARCRAIAKEVLTKQEKK